MEINGWFLNSPCLSTTLTSLNGWDCRIHVFQQNRIFKVKNVHTNLIYQDKRQLSSRNHKAPSQWKFRSVQKSLHIHHCFAWNQNRKPGKEIPSWNYHYQNQVPSLSIQVPSGVSPFKIFKYTKNINKLSHQEAWVERRLKFLGSQVRYVCWTLKNWVTKQQNIQGCKTRTQISIDIRYTKPGLCSQFGWRLSREILAAAYHDLSCRETCWDLVSRRCFQHPEAAQADLKHA